MQAYQQSQRTKSMPYEEEPFNREPSRSDSIDSASIVSKRKSKKSFLGKLISRRESSADFLEKQTHKHFKSVKHKASEAALSIPRAASAQFNRAAAGAASISSAALSAAGSTSTTPPSLREPRRQHKPSQANVLNQMTPIAPSIIPGPMFAGYYPSEHSRYRSLSTATASSASSSTPRQNSSPAASTTADRVGPSGKLISLDTDLNEMAGIVGPSTEPVPSSKLVSKPISVTPTDQNLPGWTAPESWGVFDTSPKQDPLVPKKTNVREKDPIYCVRIFRENGTFGTLACSIYSTVAELLQLLGRKFFLPSVAGYQLTMRFGGLTRILTPQEQPLIYQKNLLELMGYSDLYDRLGDLGRDDLSYLCRFTFCHAKMKTFTAEEERKMSKDFAHVDLQRMDLQTIPVMFYQHTSEIEYLDVSENPSLNIPLDFIQACANLRHIRYVSNRCRSFPSNMASTVNLNYLDLSSNFISSLDDLDFSSVSHLSSLDLQGNLLSKIPAQMAKLTHLKYLNLSSNNLTELPQALWRMKTLVDLDVSFNHVSILPPEFGPDLGLLEKLSITNNDLTKSIPESFVHLQSLKELDIRHNRLQNIDVLAKLPKLEVLYCSKNSVSSVEDSFPKLKLFFFDRNPVTDLVLTNTHFSLTVLNLRKAKISSLSESFVEKIPLVEKLVLDQNHLVSLPSHIGSLKRLINLSVVSNNLSSLPPEIGLLSELRSLDLHSNNLKNLPEELWNLSSLTSLNVSSNLLETFPKHIQQSSSVSSVESSGLLLQRQPRSVSAPSDSPVGSGGAANLDPNYQILPRRTSTVSAVSAISPREGISRASTFTSPLGLAEPPFGSSRTRATLSQSLLILSLSDNRLNDECFEEISLLSELQVLNLSYNDLIDIPYGALRRLSHLTELYLSGNNLTSLPADDMENIQTLRVLHVNSNKLHSLPAELGKITHLSVLDVGSNNLKYNINNWPYDWNWNWNLDLRYLNFSGNRRLEIKAAHNQGAMSYARDPQEKNLSDFSVLHNLRVLGLMDVTLTTPSVPDQSENCRVRTYGSEIHSMAYGLADSLGHNDNLSIADMVLERFRGNDNEAVIGLFDGCNNGNQGGNKVAKLFQETFGGIFQEELKKAASMPLPLSLAKDDTATNGSPLADGTATNGTTTPISRAPSAPPSPTVEAIRRAFLSTNKEIGNTTTLPSDEIAHSSIAHRSSTAASLDEDDCMTGSSGTVIYIVGAKMYVANVGDSMAVLSRGNGEFKLLTTRHDPTSPEELKRIRRSAGFVSSKGKLDGILDISRAVGFYNITPHVNAAPSITEHDLSETDDFLIVASKQLWEFVSYQTAVDVARSEKDDAMRAAQRLRDFAISYGAFDKIMVMVIAVGSSRRKAKLKGIATNGAGYHYGPLAVLGEEELFPALKKRRDKSLLPEDSSLARLGGEVDPPVGEVAMIFTDIKNSTSLWETYPVAMRSAIKIHNSIMRRQLRIMGGYEVKTEGDAFMVSFPTPTSALLWCFSVQSLLLVADWPAEILDSEEGCEITDDTGEIIFRGLSVRMGMHWGAPVCERDPITRRMDYFGPMVNRSSRISAVANGGQITVSSDFIAEMKRLEQAFDKVKKEGTPLSELFGDEALGASIVRDIDMLHNVGWVVKEIGEAKLKGLENPEFISVVYPKSLASRMTRHQASSNNSRVRRLGGLTLDILFQLLSISKRLEHICSGLDNRMDYNGLGPKEMSRVGENVAVVANMVPNTDADYADFFDHMITRVENSLSTLYLRAAIGKLGLGYEGDGRGSLDNLLEKLANLLGEKDHQNNKQDKGNPMELEEGSGDEDHPPSDSSNFGPTKPKKASVESLSPRSLSVVDDAVQS